MDDKDPFELLKELLSTKKIEVADGVEMICGEEINVTLRLSGQKVIIDFGAPFVFINIDKLGPLDIFDIKRRVNHIEVDQDTYTLNIDNFPDITKPRKKI